MTKIRLQAADDRMASLLDGATTVADAAQRLASDPDRLSWLPIDLRRGDLLCVLGRVSFLPAVDVIEAMQAIQRNRARQADAAYYAQVARDDEAASLARTAPRDRTDDD